MDVGGSVCLRSEEGPLLGGQVSVLVLVSQLLGPFGSLELHAVYSVGALGHLLPAMCFVDQLGKNFSKLKCDFNYKIKEQQSVVAVLCDSSL